MAKKKKNNNNNNNNNANNNEGGGEKKEEKQGGGEKKEEKQGGGEKKEEKQGGGDGGGGGGGEKKEAAAAAKAEGEKKDKPITVVLKVEMHCEGCASKITGYARSFDGVESVKADVDSNKLSVIGKVDPLKIRDALQRKAKKQVDLISPQPKKEDSNNNKDKNNSTGKKPDADNKPKEPPVTTAVLKLGFHCHGCIKKIHRIVSKTKGVHEMAVDRQKETVTVKGIMDVKALVEVLSERLKRPVEIVPPKKEDGDKEGKGKGKGGGGGGGDGDGGGGKKKKGSGGGGGQENGGSGEGNGPKNEGNVMELVTQPGFWPGFNYVGQPVYGNGYAGQPVYLNGYVGQPVYGQQDYGHGYGYGQGYGYGPGPVLFPAPVPIPAYPAHMKFNDENPNACSIM